MPVVSISITRGGAGQKKARLVDIDGLVWTFQHVPPEVEHLDQQLDYAIIDRPADFSLVEQHASGLARIRLSWLLGFADRTISIDQRLRDLKGHCRSGKLLWFDYGPNEVGWWRCVDLSWRTRARNLDGEATRADVQLELARAVDPDAGALVTLVRPVAA